MDLSHLPHNHILHRWGPANIAIVCPLQSSHCWGKNVASNLPVWVLMCGGRAEVWMIELMGHCLVWSPPSLQSRGRGEHPTGSGGCLWPALCHVTEAQPSTNPTKTLCWIRVWIVESRTSLLITAFNGKSLTELEIIRQVIYFTYRLYLF